MIKIGTLFSGIGSPEKALEYLGVDYEIQFACDNGNIEIDYDHDYEFNKVKGMKTAIEQKKYVENLYLTNSRKKNFVKQTYEANYSIHDDLYYNDVRLFDGTKFKNQLDILIGGSPCQSFSAIGQRGGFEDIRGTLFYDFARIVKESKPNVFIYENVHGLLTHDKGNTWKITQQVFDNLGYYFSYKILDSRDYGIPQGRRRLFVIGFKNKNDFNKFEFPKEKKLELTMQDLLLDNSSFGNVNRIDGEIIIKKNPETNINEKLFLSDKLYKYVTSPGTKKFYHPNAKTDLKVARALLASMGNTHRSSVNNYVTTNGKLRALDPRETARLMGYMDDFDIVVSKAQAYKQFGNSIVVDVMMEILKQILGVINEE